MHSREEWDLAMLTAVAETLENMAFMEVTVAPSDFDVSTAQNTWASILVLEPTQGEFRLILSQNLLLAIGTNMYGPATPLTPPQLTDLLAEIINTIVGRFMGQLFSLEPFRLGIPQPASNDAPPVKTETIQWTFLAEEEPLTVIASGAPMLQLCQQ